MYNQSNGSWYQFSSGLRPQISNFNVGFQRYPVSSNNFDQITGLQNLECNSRQDISGCRSTSNFDQSTMERNRPVFFRHRDPYYAYGVPPTFSDRPTVHPRMQLSSVVKETRVKKPLNAFMLFIKEMRHKVTNDNGSIGMATVHQILGRKWHAMDPSEQLVYHERAKQQREEHKRLHPYWTAKENYSVNKKKKNAKAEEMNSIDSRKCRATYGVDKRYMWCKSCRRKQRCIVNRDENRSGMNPASLSFHHPGFTPGPCGWDPAANDKSERARVVLREINHPSNAIRMPGVSMRNIIPTHHGFGFDTFQSGYQFGVSQNRPCCLAPSHTMDRWCATPGFCGAGEVDAMSEYLRYKHVDKGIDDCFSCDDSSSSVMDMGSPASESRNLGSCQLYDYPMNITPMNISSSWNQNTSRHIQENSPAFNFYRNDVPIDQSNCLPKTSQSFYPANQDGLTVSTGSRFSCRYVTSASSVQESSRYAHRSVTSCESEVVNEVVKEMVNAGLLCRLSIMDDFEVNFHMFLGRCLLFCLLLLMLMMMRVAVCAMVLLG